MDTPIYDQLVEKYEAERHSLAVQSEVVEYQQGISRKGFNLSEKALEEFLDQLKDILENSAGRLVDDLLFLVEKHPEAYQLDYIDGYLDAIDALRSLPEPNLLHT